MLLLHALSCDKLDSSTDKEGIITKYPLSVEKLYICQMSNRCIESIIQDLECWNSNVNVIGQYKTGKDLLLPFKHIDWVLLNKCEEASVVKLKIISFILNTTLLKIFDVEYYKTEIISVFEHELQLGNNESHNCIVFLLNNNDKYFVDFYTEIITSDNDYKMISFQLKSLPEVTTKQEFKQQISEIDLSVFEKIKTDTLNPITAYNIPIFNDIYIKKYLKIYEDSYIDSEYIYIKRIVPDIYTFSDVFSNEIDKPIKAFFRIDEEGKGNIQVGFIRNNIAIANTKDKPLSYIIEYFYVHGKDELIDMFEYTYNTSDGRNSKCFVIVSKNIFRNKHFVDIFTDACTRYCSFNRLDYESYPEVFDSVNNKIKSRLGKDLNINY
jgi:hypothetical protein